MSRPSQCLALSDAGPTPRECSPTLCVRGPPASRARIRGWKRHWPWAPGLRLEGERPGDASRSGRGAEAGRPGARLRAPPHPRGAAARGRAGPPPAFFPCHLLFSSSSPSVGLRRHKWVPGDVSERLSTRESAGPLAPLSDESRERGERPCWDAGH